jgi:phosphatidylglycerol:prolipoprotein diacylglycerol transferase
MPVELIAARHPSQLYQALLEGLVLAAYMQVRFWSVKGRGPDSATSACRSARPGHLMGEFLIGYSILRSLGELFREPDASLILGMSRGSFYSIFLLIAGVGLIVWTRRGQLTKS